jgi:WD40 repeat protein
MVFLRYITYHRLFNDHSIDHAFLGYPFITNYTKIKREGQLESHVRLHHLRCTVSQHLISNLPLCCQLCAKLGHCTLWQFGGTMGCNTRTTTDHNSLDWDPRAPTISSLLVKINKTSGSALCKTMRGHTKLVEGVVHLPGGQRIVTCSRDSSLRLCDLESDARIDDDWQDKGNQSPITKMRHCNFDKCGSIS